MFDLEKDSEADAKTAISFAPAATAASNPCTYSFIAKNQNMYWQLCIELLMMWCAVEFCKNII
jgi:hypothetical protein